MIKTQIQLPDELYHALKRVAEQREWSLAETLRRGAEYIVQTHPLADHAGEPWTLKTADLGMRPLDDDALKALARETEAAKGLASPVRRRRKKQP